MLHRKLSKWIYTVSNNCIKFPRTFFFFYKILLFPSERESAYHSKLSPEIHGTSILMEIFPKRNNKSWNVVIKMNIGNHPIQPSLILLARIWRPGGFNICPRLHG